MEDKQSERCSPREKGNVPYPMETISLHLSARREEEEEEENECFRSDSLVVLTEFLVERLVKRYLSS
jgi:hypothetical protein